MEVSTVFDQAVADTEICSDINLNNAANALLYTVLALPIARF